MDGYLKHVIWQEAFKLDNIVLYQYLFLFVGEVLAIKTKSDPNLKSTNINVNNKKYAACI